MQGIKSTQHQYILKALEKFNDLAPVFGSIVPEDREAFIRDKAAELKGTYDYYQLLLKELEQCIQSYEGMHESLRKVVYPYVRKMNTQIQKQVGKKGF